MKYTFIFFSDINFPETKTDHAVLKYVLVLTVSKRLFQYSLHVTGRTKITISLWHWLGTQKL